MPGKVNSKQQEEWLAEYEKLKANLPAKETICFTDGVHPTHNVQPAYGWIKKGEHKAVPTNAGRNRLNLAGAIDILSHRIHIREDETLNGTATIAFLRQLGEAYPTMNEVHVFCDNASYYRSNEVKNI